MIPFKHAPLSPWHATRGQEFREKEEISPGDVWLEINGANRAVKGSITYTTELCLFFFNQYVFRPQNKLKNNHLLVHY
jgi:hypothetical protein